MAKIYEINTKRNIKNIPKEKKNIVSKILANKETFFTLEDEMKYDYEVIQNIFLFYRRDVEFLKRVYKNIINVIEEHWILEFLLKMLQILEQENICDKEKKLRISIQMIINFRTMEILDAVNKIVIEPNLDGYGYGFILVENKFNYSETIMDYFAKIFLNYILNELNIEGKLHKSYSSYEEFEIANESLQKYVMDYISLEDIALKNYILRHPKTWEEAETIFKQIKTNWTNYRQREKQYFLENSANQILDYIVMRTEKNSEISERLWQISNYVAYNFGVFEELAGYTIGKNREYLKTMKKICKHLKKRNKEMIQTMDYLYLEKILKTNAQQITDFGLRKELLRRSSRESKKNTKN